MVLIRDKVEKYGRTIQVTGENITLRRKIRFACRITKAKIQTLMDNT
jgi:hypothetical protein